MMAVDTQMQALSLEESMAHLHSLTILAPVIFFTAALICDLFFSFGKKRAVIVGHWFVIAGWVACMPAILTGLEAAKGFDVADEFLQMHRWLGFALGILASLYAGLRISAMVWKLPITSNWYLVMSVVLLALVSWASDYGLLVSAR